MQGPDPGPRGPCRRLRAEVSPRSTQGPASCPRPTPPPPRAPWGPRRLRPPDRELSPPAQVREAYLQFMTSVAAMLRADMNLPENSYLVQEEMVQVLELETQLANVRPRGGGGAGAGSQGGLAAPPPV